MIRLYRNYIGLIILLGVALLPKLLTGEQTYVIEHLNTRHGLSQNDVHAIHQDQYGFMWFGTAGGLNRFDGINYRLYKQNNDDTTTISDNRITIITEDSQGNLWIGTRNGLNRYDHTRDIFINPVFNDGTYYITDLFIDEKDDIWISTLGQGLYKYSIPSDSLTDFKLKKNEQGISETHITAIFKSREGHYWFGSHFGDIYKYIPDSSQIIHFKASENPAINNNGIRDIYQDQQGRIYANVITSGIFYLDKDKDQFKKLSVYNYTTPNYLLSPNRMIPEDDNSFWLGTYNDGILLLTYQGEILRHFRKSNNSETDLISETILSITKDQTGSIWVGTAGGGITKFTSSVFQHYNSYDHELSSNMIWSFYQDNKTLWIGTLNGINILNLETDTIHQILQKSDTRNTLSSSAVWSIAKDPFTEEFWLATSRGLDVYRPETDSFRHYYHDDTDSTSICYDYISILLVDSKNRLWIGTDYGFARYNRDQDNFTNYQANPQKKNSISSNDIVDIIEDNKGDIWIASRDQGISILNPETNRFRYLNTDHGLENNFIIALYQDSRNTVWIGTTNGLHAYDPLAGTIDYFVEEDGLPNSYIYGILEDKKGNIWLSTNRGLSKYDWQNQSFTNYFEEDGLQNNEFNLNAYRKLQDGRLVFGGINGFNLFHPDDIHKNRIRPNLIFTGLKIFNKKVEIDQEINHNIPLQSSLTSQKNITLTHQDDFFSISFALLDFQNMKTNQYFYKLEGVHKDWISLDNDPEAYFTNLNTGIYNLKIRAINNDMGTFSTNQLTLRILPPWWNTKLIKFLYLVILMGMFYLAHYRRTKRIRKKARDLKEHNQRLNSLISQVRSTESALAKAREYVVDIIDSSPSIIIGVDIDGNITHWNKTATKVFANVTKPVLGRRAYDLLPYDSKTIDKIVASIAQQQTEIIEKLSRRHKGKIIHETITVYPLTNFDKPGAVIRIDDISETVNMQEMMIQSEKMLSVGGLAAGMAHEINNPLAGILQNIIVLRNRLTKNTPKNITAAEAIGLDFMKLQQYLNMRRVPIQLDMITKSSHRASKLVNSMLSFARKSNAHFIPCDIAGIMEDSINLIANDYNMRKNYDFKKINIHTDYAKNLPKVHCDPIKIQQVFINILKNGAEAMTYSPAPNQKQCFTIRIFPTETHMRIEIENNGPVIPEEIKKRIFEPFYTTKGIGEGTGLGLSVSYFIITENHNGKMGLKAGDAPGFIIELPIEKQSGGLKK